MPLSDGAQFIEEPIPGDAATRSLRCRILASPAPVVGHHSTLAFKASRDGSTVVWISEFKVKGGRFGKRSQEDDRRHPADSASTTSQLRARQGHRS